MDLICLILVEGQTALIESPKMNLNLIYSTHYETFTVPANVKEYTIRPLNDEIIKVIKAYVRTRAKSPKHIAFIIEYRYNEIEIFIDIR